jgi:hypothetical protein
MHHLVVTALTSASLLVGVGCKPRETEATEARRPATTVTTVSTVTPAPTDATPTIPTAAPPVIPTDAPTLDAGVLSLDEARDAYLATVKDQLVEVDARLGALAARGDARAHDVVAGLKIRRAQLAVQIDTMKSISGTAWVDVKRNVMTTIADLDRDLGSATK